MQAGTVSGDDGETIRCAGARLHNTPWREASTWWNPYINAPNQKELTETWTYCKSVSSCHGLLNIYWRWGQSLRVNRRGKIGVGSGAMVHTRENNRSSTGDIAWSSKSRECLQVSEAQMENLRAGATSAENVVPKHVIENIRFHPKFRSQCLLKCLLEQSQSFSDW